MILPLEKQLVSLPLAKKMKELGFEQKGLFWWVMKHPYSLVLPGPSWELVYTSQLVGWDEDEYIYCSAYTVAELCEMLPPTVKAEFISENSGWLDIFRSDVGGPWICKYVDAHMESAETLADALAKMLINYLKSLPLLCSPPPAKN